MSLSKKSNLNSWRGLQTKRIDPNAEISTITIGAWEILIDLNSIEKKEGRLQYYYLIEHNHKNGNYYYVGFLKDYDKLGKCIKCKTKPPDSVLITAQLLASNL